MRTVIIVVTLVTVLPEIADLCEDPPRVREWIRTHHPNSFRKKRQLFAEFVLNSAGSRSSCSWTEVPNVNETRRPQTMYHARCNHQHCTGRGATYGCEMHYRKFDVVVIVGCENNTNTWIFSQESIPVTCICAARRFGGSGSVS